MHSFIITGADKEKRITFIQNECKKQSIKSFDIVTLTLEDNSIGIEDVRTFQKQLLLVPYASPYTMAIILGADHLTHEAQQALLKTLEEPPPHVRLYLEAENIDSLLPTIRSRCQQILIATDSEKNTIDDAVETRLFDLLEASFASRAITIDEISATRDSALLFIQHAIGSARSQMKKSKARKQGKILLQLLFRAKEYLEANVTPKLVLDVFWITGQKLLTGEGESQIREE